VEGSDILATIAQIAVTLAGFTGIVVVLGDPGGRLIPIQIYRVAILIALSLGAMTLALVPFGLHLTGLEGAALWRPASALLGAFSALLVIVFFPPTRRFFRQFPEIFNPAILTALAVGHVVNVAVQAAIAFGGFENQRAGLYVFGLLWLLLHGAYQFVRILFIPLKSR
jgi:hypothetical protein